MLSQGRPYLAIPGPSVMPDRVLAAMHRPAPNIYKGEIIELAAGLIGSLRGVARTAHAATIYIANGHAVWEAALVNTLAPGDRALVLASGRFGHGWAEMARGLGIEVEVMDFGPTLPADPDRLAARLAEDRAGRIRAVAVCHVDTSSSARSDIPALRAAIDRAGHGALLLVDCIASMGCDRFEMDLWGVDVAIAASQKGLMTPPGLGFVWFNDRAAAARARRGEISRYWDWRPRAAPEALWQYFDGTAPTHHLYGLREALAMIAEEGIEAVWARHEVLARAIWAAFDAWSAAGPLALNIADPAARSHAVTACVIGSPFGARLQDWTERVAGLTLGIGLGRSPEDGYFRIGHMGHVNAQMILGVLGTIEAGLQALGVPHGAGAVDRAAAVIAGAAPAG